MADLKAYTSVYSFPYPLPGDSVQNTYTRIQELAERIEATYVTLGINLDSAAALLQVGDSAGGALTGSYPNPTLNPNVFLPNGMKATTQAQQDNSNNIATTAYVDAYIAGTVPDGSIGTAELADGSVTEAKLAFSAATQAELDAHTSATTSVHGITDTANLVYTDDSRLTDERTPTDGSVTNDKVNASAAIAYSKLNLADSIVNADVAAGAAIAYSKLALTGSITEADLSFSVATQSELDTVASNAATALSSHESDTTSIHGISDTANLVYTNDSRLSDSRTPTGSAGGVLSGTYPNPGFAVDMATQTELDNHASDTTSVHGIADTSVLATQTDVSTAVSTHSSDTTSVHGISDTANLVYTNDSRLSDSRTPTGSAGGVLSGTYPDPGFAVDMATQSELDNHASDTTSVHGIADTSVLATSTDVSTAVSTHASATTSVHGIADTSLLETTSGAQTKADAAESAANSYTDSAMSTHEAAADPHPQYLTSTEGNAAYDALGAASSAVSAHEAAADPHPQYLTSAEGNAAYDALGAASAAQSAAQSYADSAVTTHAAITTSVHGITNAADLVYTSDSRLSDARTPTAHATSHESGGADEIEIAPAQVTGTAVVDSDARLTDARTPTGSAGGVLSGTYPNPSFAVDMATQTELDNHALDTTSVHGIADTSLLATTSDVSTAQSNAQSYADSAVTTHTAVTTSVHGISNTADLVYTADSRLTDARTPTTHASSHAAGGADEIDVSPSQVDTTGGSISDVLTIGISGAEWSPAGTPGAHASTHTSGGSDEIDVAPSQITYAGASATDVLTIGVSGPEWAPAGSPTAHAATHEPGGSDRIVIYFS